MMKVYSFIVFKTVWGAVGCMSKVQSTRNVPHASPVEVNGIYRQGRTISMGRHARDISGRLHLKSSISNVTFSNKKSSSEVMWGIFLFFFFPSKYQYYLKNLYNRYAKLTVFNFVTDLYCVPSFSSSRTYIVPFLTHLFHLTLLLCM